MTSPAWKYLGDRIMPPQDVMQVFKEPAKACPFCGSLTVGLWVGPSPHITCGTCGADGPTFDGPASTLKDRQYKALQAWQKAKR